MFLLFNVILFLASAILIFTGFQNFSLFMSLPLSLEILIVIGFITPVMNLYDTIKNFLSIAANPNYEDDNENQM